MRGMHASAGWIGGPSGQGGLGHGFTGFDGTGDGAGNDFPTGRLLGPCVEAAFAEVLNVDAKATNGWRRLDEYDADAVRAFALAPGSGDEI